MAVRAGCCCSTYFYPRPPRGGRRLVVEVVFDLIRFLSTPSARRATGSAPLNVCLYAVFLSTPSARRATESGTGYRLAHQDFYPRPPRGGRQLHRVCAAQASDFYPRPPRGGRLIFSFDQYSALRFLSTPSARRATGKRAAIPEYYWNFYPRPPRGGRLRGGIRL